METIITEIWRPVYGKLQQGIALLTPEWSRLKQLKNFDQLSPRAINWPVELTNGGGMAWTSNGGSTARATSNSPVEATDTWKHLTGRFEVGFDELKAENAGRFSRQQIEKQLKYQARDKLKSFRRSIAIGFYGYPNAILFLATGANVSNPSGTETAFEVDSLYGKDGLGFDRIRDYLTKDKDYVAVHDGTTSTIRGEGVVNDIDESTGIITLDSGTYFGASIADGDAVVLYNQVKNDDTDDLDQGINGLLHLCLSTTVHGISSADEPDWAPTVEDESYNAALSGKDFYKFFEEIENRSDHKVQWVYTTHGAIAEAGGAELDQRRYGADEDTMRLGFRKLNVMGVQAEATTYAPAGYAFFGSNSALRKLSPDEAQKPEDVVTSGDRSGGFKQYGDQLGFYKDQIMRAQLTAVSRAGLGILGGITEA